MYGIADFILNEIIDDLIIPRKEVKKVPIKSFKIDGITEMKLSPMYINPNDIKRVQFDENNRATIVFFKDGTKSVVVAQDGDEYDREMGLAMALLKHYFKNAKEFNSVFRKWCPECFR